MPKFLEEPQNPGVDDGRCALCKKDGVDEEDRCYGCGYLVCEDCSVNMVMGPHYVIDHKEEL